MYNESNFIESLLDETLGYDMREEYADLLSDWYGDDISLFDPDDEDLNIAFRRLNNTYTFWKTSRYVTSPYQKLRMKYDLLLESYMQLIEDLQTALHEKGQLAKFCYDGKRQVVTTKTNGGCNAGLERRASENGRTDAA